MSPLLVVGLGLVALGWLTRKSVSPRVAGAAPLVGRFLGQKLRKGQTYRLMLRARREDMVRPEVERLGFEVLLVTKDPSQQDLYSVLGRWTLPASEIRRTALLAILDVTHVETPPVDAVARAVVGCDPGLTEGELDALRWALAEDNNPKHLGGFARTFEPDYPACASMLRVKSALVQLRSLGTEKTQERQDRASLLRANFVSTCKLADPSHLWDRFVLLDPVQFLAGSVGILGAHVRERITALRAKLPLTPSPYRMWVLTELGKAPTAVPVTNELVSRYALLPGATPEAKHAAMASTAELIAALRAELANEPSGAVEVRTLIAKLVKDSALLRRSSEEIARAYRVSEPVARAALACVLDLGEAGQLVNGFLLGALVPSPPPRPTASALALASTTLKPTLSTVTDPKAAIARSLQVVKAAEGGDPKAKAARAQLGRAVKTLERAKWVRWYKKVRTSGR